MELLCLLCLAFVTGTYSGVQQEPEQPPIPGQFTTVKEITPPPRIYPPGPGNPRGTRPPFVYPPGPGEPNVRTPVIDVTTPKSGEGPIRPSTECSDTTRRYMDHDAAAAELTADGVTLVSPDGGKLCITRSIKWCTSLKGIRQEAVEGIKKLAQNSSCSMAVIEGTEVGRPKSKCSHEEGWRLSVVKNSCIDVYIRRNFKKRSRQHYTDSSGNLYTNLKTKWNILFAPKYECPCDPPVPDKASYTHDEAREMFDNNYIVTTDEFNNMLPCKNKDIDYCTHYGGLRSEAMLGILKLKNESGCGVEIIGATETRDYHAGCTYRNKLQISLRNDLCIYRYIQTNFVQRSRQHYIDADGNLFIRFDKSWDIQFKSTEKSPCSLASLDASVFSHNEAREILDRQYIVTTDEFSHLSPCAFKKTDFCTHYGGLRRDAIVGVIELKNRTGCVIEIVDGTEAVKGAASCWHSQGLELAVKKNKCLDDYIVKSLPKLKKNQATTDKNFYIQRKKSWGIRFPQPLECP